MWCTLRQLTNKAVSMSGFSCLKNVVYRRMQRLSCHKLSRELLEYMITLARANMLLLPTALAAGAMS